MSRLCVSARHNQRSIRTCKRQPSYHYLGCCYAMLCYAICYVLLCGCNIICLLLMRRHPGECISKLALLDSVARPASDRQTAGRRHGRINRVGRVAASFWVGHGMSVAPRTRLANGWMEEPGLVEARRIRDDRESHRSSAETLVVEVDFISRDTHANTHDRLGWVGLGCVSARRRKRNATG